MTLGKCGHMHFGSSDAMVAATSQMIYDALRWMCAASVVVREVGRATVKNLVESGSTPAVRARKATPASSGDESDSDARLRIPARGDCEQALIASAADGAEACKKCHQQGGRGREGIAGRRV